MLRYCYSEAVIGVSSARAILATLFWVVQSQPYLDQENHWGLDGEWESRDKHS
jgi:hypothetical protein